MKINHTGSIEWITDEFIYRVFKYDGRSLIKFRYIGKLYPKSIFTGYRETLQYLINN